MKRMLWIFLLVGLLSPQVFAVNGLSVTTHWSGQNENRTYYGGFGEIWRHDIENSEVTGHTMLFAGPARMAVLNYTGTHVAFIKESGMLAVMSTEGGAVTDLVQGHPQGCLDWPEGDWIYFSLGTWGLETSKYLYRVHAFTGVEEMVVEFESTTWRFGIARDHRRAAVRDTSVQNTIVAYDLQLDNGQMRDSRAVDVPSCGTGMDPEGEYFIDGMWDHSGMDIRRWDDLEIVETFTHTDATQWGGRDSGEGHNRNGWSTNSQEWICGHIGWNLHFSSDSRGSNQVLYNWVTHERIVVTDNTDNSYTYDSAGDFWVNVNADNEAPNVNAGSDQTVNIHGTALLDGSATDDGLIRSPLTVAWAQLSGPGTALVQNPYQARTTVEFDQPGVYVLELTANDGIYFSSDEVEVTVTDQAYILLESPNGGEVWQVGSEQAIRWQAVGIDDVTIAYSSDLGDTWQRISFTVDVDAPEWGNLPWVVPDDPSTECLVSISAYIDGEGKVVSEQPFEIRGFDVDIELQRPSGGETFKAGSKESIQWTSAEVDTVLLSYSTDDGTTWHPIEFVEKNSEHWGDYAWLVPNDASTQAKIAVSDRNSWFRRKMSPAFTIVGGSGDGGSSDGGGSEEPDGCGCVSSGQPVFLTVLILLGAALFRRRSSARFE